MSLLQRLTMAGCILPGLMGHWAHAQDISTETPKDSNVFVLGTIVINAKADESNAGGTSAAISPEEILTTNRQTLDDALRTQPGVTVGNTGGSRNERLIYVRGFDRIQVPLSIDGIRVYLPADNRLDFGRFLTPDLAEVQIQKGYVSVLNGPGAMGGAINLVTRTPTKPFEGEARVGIEAGNRGDITAKSSFLSFGTKQEQFYAQGSYMWRDSDGFYLSKDFKPTPEQRAGLRDYTDTKDTRLNLKVGYTPNATDEYVLSYTRQTGSKNAPYNVDQPIRGITPPPLPANQAYQRDWSWPTWNIESLAFYSNTALGETGYLKTKLYYNTFDNVLKAYDDYTHSTQIERRAFNSVYDDKAYGLSIEGGADITPNNTLRAALHYRRDKHDDTQLSRPDVNTIPDPTKRSEEETWSLALENTWRASDALTVVAGLSYDRAKVIEASRTDTNFGWPTGSSDAVNWQLAALYATDVGDFHASLSDRTRFPTLFNRYSTRFGSARPNPDLKSERATTVELGYGGDLGPVALQGAIFHSRIKDMIQSVPVGVDVNNAIISQSQNVGKGRISGLEVSASYEITSALAVTGNYTYMHRTISDPVRDGLRSTDIPRHAAYIRLDWQLQEDLRISPSLELASSRWSDSAIQPSDPTQVAYSRVPGFGLLNLDMDWQVTEQANIVFGLRNILDKNYALVEGFPEAGRSMFLTTRLTF